MLGRFFFFLLNKVQLLLLYIAYHSSKLSEKKKLMETKEGRRKGRATSQGRGSAWVEPKQVLLLVAPSMLCLFPVFICLCSLSPRSLFTYLHLSLCFHTMPATATKINLSKPQPSPWKKSLQQSFGTRFPLGDLGSCCPWGFYKSTRQSIIVQTCTTSSTWTS